ncbi:molybdopterin molybdotransferase MoeA [Desulfurivibrio alkaliphilus]|uniref:Molybdopterin molybdenumtransferase n=1 Tax=Desulfurivibrio alkaliphilus (strain DSM 19089 / UNIQEM U267 / AHT2) TaxID=589865 RepID=D6Z521_DESAT|nr:molybdopterin molybdotransferase MoeA [Desulfurivibrio alkaliphilus]ADH86646.1 molybdenum cofactor synthesis domain protein [Desulfurivibrio alkaliphilus AHT 2]
MTILTLQQAQRQILAHSRPGLPEMVPLERVLGRIPATAARARLAVPSFPHSSRDGYALLASDSQETGGAEETAGYPPRIRLAVVGEIAAGRTRPAKRLQPGQAYRIMTGGLLPPGADAVIPFERVYREEEDYITLSSPCRPGDYIRPVGADLRRGQIIVTPGRPVAPEHLPRLATAGVGELAVYPRPRVGLLCTGSELLDDTGENPVPGHLISGNRFLLAGLIRRWGGEPVDLGTVKDDPGAIAAILHRQAESGLAMIISTGGMGPGKYDLVDGVLTRLQAHLLYRELRLRPGKATMAALLGSTLFFGLPGPPPAVHLLFYLLVAPALRRAQGHHRPRPLIVQAHLRQALKLRRGRVIQLKDAQLQADRGRLLVRPLPPGETMNAIILAPANRRELLPDELVRVFPLRQNCHSDLGY